MPTERSSPYIWVTWLSKLLSGEASCEWASWFKAHYERGSYSQMPSTFDQAVWHVNHTRLVNRVLDRFEGEGRSVSVEAQNQFTLVGRVAPSVASLTSSQSRGNRSPCATPRPDNHESPTRFRLWPTCTPCRWRSPSTRGCQ